MPDTGTSSHFTPCLLDLQEVEEGLDLGVEVADDHFVAHLWKPIYMESFMFQD